LSAAADGAACRLLALPPPAAVTRRLHAVNLSPLMMLQLVRSHALPRTRLHHSAVVKNVILINSRQALHVTSPHHAAANTVASVHARDGAGAEAHDVCKFFRRVQERALLAVRFTSPSSVPPAQIPTPLLGTSSHFGS
jgi:hypothetical protein